jgi:isoamylase
VSGTGLAWFNPDGTPATSQDWDNPYGHSFAVMFPPSPPGPAVLALFNAYWGPVPYTLPVTPSGQQWAIVLDTTQEDGTPTTAAPLAAGATVPVGPRSVVIATG